MTLSSILDSGLAFLIEGFREFPLFLQETLSQHPEIGYVRFLPWSLRQNKVF
jgi:hypothetical protein